MSVILEPIEGKGLKIPIDKGIVFIGRHPDCDVVITRSRMISRKHCAIVQVNDTLVIRDLGSTNGVRINGDKVRKEGRFRPGDQLTIGDLEYLVKVVKNAEPERRDNRDHPQDARAAGAAPMRIERPENALDPFSAEIPIALPEGDEAFDDGEGSVTPDSFPVVPKRDLDDAELDDSDRARPQIQREYADSDSHVPIGE